MPAENNASQVLLVQHTVAGRVEVYDFELKIWWLGLKAF